MQEGALAELIKRIPAIANSRREMAEALRVIRRMNPAAAKYALHHIRRQRQRVWPILDEEPVSIAFRNGNMSNKPQADAGGARAIAGVQDRLR